MGEFDSHAGSWGGLFDTEGKLAREQADCRREGTLLVVAKGARLPDYCVKCGEPAERRLPRKFSWHAPGYYFLLFLSLPIYLIVALLNRETAHIDMGFCERHWGRRRTWIMVGWLAALGGIAATVTGFNVEGAEPLILVGMLMLLAGLIGGIIGSRTISPEKIDSRFAWMIGCHPDFLVIACGGAGGPMSDPWIDGP